MLTDKQILENWKAFRSKIDDLFKSRAQPLNDLYDYYEERMFALPASGVEFYHNAFNGGYVEHVLGVVDFAEKEYNHWKELGMKVDNFTLEELLFAAFHHDLGKVGLPGNYQTYQPNLSEWHRKNQGKLFTNDSRQPFALVPDLSIFILQHFGVKMTFQEMLAIRTHDGLYDDANKSYFVSWSIESKPRTNINQILHDADMKRARFEFERWAKQNPEKFKFYYDDGIIVEPEVKSTKTDKPTINIDDIFKDF